MDGEPHERGSLQAPVKAASVFPGGSAAVNPSIPGDPGRELGRHDGWVIVAIIADGRVVGGSANGLTLHRLTLVIQ